MEMLQKKVNNFETPLIPESIPHSLYIYKV